MSDFNYEYEDQDELISCISEFINRLIELEDENRGDPSDYHYASENFNEVDLTDASDEDVREAISKIPSSVHEEFKEYLLEEGHIGYEKRNGYHTYTGEITSYPDESYSLSFLGWAGIVNGVEVEDIGKTLYDALEDKTSGWKKALRDSFASSVEQWSDEEYPEYLYAEADDYTSVVLMAYDLEELEEVSKQWLLARKRGNPNKKGRSVVKDGKRFKVGYDGELEPVKDEELVESIRRYMKKRPKKDLK